MEVSNYKAYRIVDVINGSEYNVGDTLTIEKYSLDDYIPKKEAIEQAFEANRPSDFPSRNEILFVFPESEHDYESVWTNYKYNHYEKEYLLLELDLTGNLYWLDASHYNNNVLLRLGQGQQAEEEVKRYWQEVKAEDFTRDMDIEGLFTGTAVITAITRKRHSENGNNVEIQ